MIKNVLFWLNCARLYTLPITIISWAVIFVYSLSKGGNPILGIISFFGIALTHLATNLADDYFDYKFLTKDENFINSAKEFKCAYLKSGQASLNDLRNVIIIFLVVAAIIGFYLLFQCGYYIIILAIIGALIAVTYPLLSQNSLGEVAVIFAYGPLLFEGVYYVMCGHFSWDVLFLSISCGIITNTILYAHMIMDFDQDECSHKKTLCRALKTKTNALNFLIVFYLMSYLMITCVAFRTHNYWYLLPLLTIPMVIDLYKLLKLYNDDKITVPTIRFWHKPLFDKNKITSEKTQAFLFRFLYARNIMVWFMLLVCIAIILG